MGVLRRYLWALALIALLVALALAIGYMQHPHGSPDLTYCPSDHTWSTTYHPCPGG